MGVYYDVRFTVIWFDDNWLLALYRYFTKRGSMKAAKGGSKTVDGVKKVRVGFSRRGSGKSRFIPLKRKGSSTPATQWVIWFQWRVYYGIKNIIAVILELIRYAIALPLSHSMRFTRSFRSLFLFIITLDHCNLYVLPKVSHVSIPANSSQSLSTTRNNALRLEIPGSIPFRRHSYGMAYVL